MNFIHHSWMNDLIRPSNPTTDKVLEMVDEGALNARDALLMALKWIGEEGVAQMCRANEIEIEERATDEG